MHSNSIMYQTIGNAFPMKRGRASLLASVPSAWQPPCQIDRCAAFAEQGHHGGGMMRCNGGVKEGRIGAGGDYSSSMQTRASINDDGRQHPTVAMGSHSWLLSIQQSTNILCDRTMSLKLEKVIIGNVI